MWLSISMSCSRSWIHYLERWTIYSLKHQSKVLGARKQLVIFERDISTNCWEGKGEWRGHWYCIFSRRVLTVPHGLQWAYGKRNSKIYFPWALSTRLVCSYISFFFLLFSRITSHTHTYSYSQMSQKYYSLNHSEDSVL